MKKQILCIALSLALTGCAAKTPAPSPSPSPSPTPVPTVTPAAVKDFSAIDNTGSGWGLKKNKGAAPEVSPTAATLFPKYHAYYMDTSGEKKLYLTFDEGYENGYTGQILDTLQKTNVPAAFFITGPYLETEKPLVERMVNEGHIVGNHTVHHPNLPKLGDAKAMQAELTALADAFYAEFQTPMQYMRPPEGEFSERLLAAADSLGYKTIFWSFAYKDWDIHQQNGAAYAFGQVTPYLHDGAILLLHAVSKDNADALEDIIAYAQSQGYTFCSLDELR